MLKWSIPLLVFLIISFIGILIIKPGYYFSSCNCNTKFFLIKPVNDCTNAYVSTLDSAAARHDDDNNGCNGALLFSEKECGCVPDPHGCKGLSKIDCEKTPYCFSYSRGGSCDCPTCKNLLAHQCLPTVCGNGVCERCESTSECCNYPCNADGACSPPSCVGWCAKDCQAN